MSKSIRVLHLTTHNEECGIARYQEQFVEGMKIATDIENIFFDVSPNKTRFMTEAEYVPILRSFEKQLESCDILHIQHELSFYKHRELESVISLAGRMGKPVIVTIHTALDVEYKKATLRGLAPRAIKLYASERRRQKQFERIHLNPLKQADLIVVHNETTKQSLISHGFAADRIRKIHLPVPRLSFKKKSAEIKKALHYQSGDVLYCTVGFISPSKGVDQAVKALTELPPNYKLAIIGGLHPRGGDQPFLKELTQYIAEHSLGSRVHITGYVEDDERLNAMIRECDLCVYPYDAHYYSYVSSAALNNALANHKAVVAYANDSFRELNEGSEVIKLCSSPSYHELAKQIQSVNIGVQTKRSENYAEKYAYDKEAIKFAAIYRALAAGQE